MHTRLLSFLFCLGPIFLLAYFAVSTILFYFFKEELLKIKVQNYADLKKINQELSQQIKGKEDKILQVKIGNKYRLIDLQDIVWMEADEYCTCIHTKEKRPLKTRKSLKYFAAELAGTPFLRVHRKSIVNMQMVKTFVTTPSPKLILMDGTEIPISQRKLKSVKEYYKNLKL